MLSRLVRLMSSPGPAWLSHRPGKWPGRAAPARHTFVPSTKLKMWNRLLVVRMPSRLPLVNSFETIESRAQTLYSGIAASLSALTFSVDAQLLLAHAPRDDHLLRAGANSEPSGFSLLAESDLEAA